MTFGEKRWDILLPENILAIDKERLKRLLSQFFDPTHRQGDKRYDGFYHTNPPPKYFLQGDLLHSVMAADWDYDANSYSSGYSPVVLLSNTCDVSDDNDRELGDKQALYAPIVSVEDYFKTLRQEFQYDESKIKSIHGKLKSQTYSNLFYLPPNHKNQKDYILFLDNIFWQPSSILKDKIKRIDSERFVSLNYFGFYLLITKLSYHFCRVPEELDR